MAVPFQIRPATPADVPALLALERVCFPDPWSERGIAESLAPPNGGGLVAASARGVVGYLITREVGGSGEILNLAIAPGTRRQGVGGALLRAGLAALGARGVVEVFLEVRESNEAARELYQRAGFRVVGARRGYYRSPSEDALVMRLEIGPSE